MAVIFKMSDAVAIGLHASMFLALEEDRGATARRIAQKFDISESHLVKVLQALNRAGLTRSTRGPGGGYRLSRPAAAIRLLDVVEAIEGPLTVQECMLNHPICKNRKCILGPLVRNINTRTIDYLREHNVKDLAATLAAAENQ